MRLIKLVIILLRSLQEVGYAKLLHFRNSGVVDIKELKLVTSRDEIVYLGRTFCIESL